MSLAEFLGAPSARLLEDGRFEGWHVKRRGVEHDSNTRDVAYTLERGVLEFNCEADANERITCLFVKAQSHRGVQLSDLSFEASREQVLERLGSPSKSSKGLTHPVLGTFGPWDRFTGPAHTVHVQYEAGGLGIAMVTLMCNEVAP